MRAQRRGRAALRMADCPIGSSPLGAVDLSGSHVAKGRRRRPLALQTPVSRNRCEPGWRRKGFGRSSPALGLAGARVRSWPGPTGRCCGGLRLRAAGLGAIDGYGVRDRSTQAVTQCPDLGTPGYAIDVYGPEPTLGGLMAARVGIIMGSRSDWDTMQHGAQALSDLGIAHEVQVVSAHRTPDLLFHYAAQAEGRGLRVLIAGAGGAAHLPGMVAAKTMLPVLGVPVQSQALNGLDSLLSIVQMPAGVPVATFAIGKAGAINAALFAAALLAAYDSAIREALAAFRARQTEAVLAHGDPRIP